MESSWSLAVLPLYMGPWAMSSRGDWRKATRMEVSKSYNLVTLRSFAILPLPLKGGRGKMAKLRLTVSNPLGIWNPPQLVGVLEDFLWNDSTHTQRHALPCAAAHCKGQPFCLFTNLSISLYWKSDRVECIGIVGEHKCRSLVYGPGSIWTWHSPRSHPLPTPTASQIQASNNSGQWTSSQCLQLTCHPPPLHTMSWHNLQQASLAQGTYVPYEHSDH